MRKPWLTICTRFFLPGGLLFLFGVWALTHPVKAWISSETVLTLFFLFLAAGLLIAWRFNSIGSFFSLLVLSGLWVSLDWLCRHHISVALRDHALLLLMCLLPINFAIFTFLKDHGLFSIHSLLRTLFLAVQAVIIVRLFQTGSNSWLLVLDHLTIPGLPAHFGKFPQIAILLFALSLAVIFFIFVRRRSPIAAGAFWAVASASILFSDPLSRFYSLFYISLAQLVIIVSLVQRSFNLAYLDELTGLPGRRALNETLAVTAGTYTVLMIDIDHFKRFNDRHGHDVGDQVLKLVASRLASVGAGGKAFRYGGEEFTVVFPGRSLQETLPHAENLRSAVEKATFVLRQTRSRKKSGPDKRKTRSVRGKKLSVTVSIGVAESSHTKSNQTHILKAADKALYRAKRAGRNRVSK